MIHHSVMSINLYHVQGGGRTRQYSNPESLHHVQDMTTSIGQDQQIL